jgi:DNA replication and repair protein RecF
MALNHLSIHNLRNIQAASIEPCERLNLIYGPNGSGKTSLLEAIYLLGRGKSFRSAYSRRIVRHDQDELTVFAKIRSADGGKHSLGLQIKEGRIRAKANGAYEQKSSNLAQLLPLLLISPDGDKLIKGSPRQRRRFLDWGLFHVEHDFLAIWQRYNRLLYQRNALLRQRKREMLPPWDSQLVEVANHLDRFRREYVTILAHQAERILSQLLEIDGLEFRYLPGWPGTEDYGSALQQSLESDLKAGFTQRGPHRADLSLKVGGRAAAEVLSGGQQKLAACALLLAQASVFNQRKQENCVILVDDLPAELDSRHRHAFMELLYSIGGQLFVTVTDRHLLDVTPFAERRMFHVEHGQVTLKKEDGEQPNRV